MKPHDTCLVDCLELSLWLDRLRLDIISCNRNSGYLGLNLVVLGGKVGKWNSLLTLAWCLCWWLLRHFYLSTVDVCVGFCLIFGQYSSNVLDQGSGVLA